jgi:hypothetical protein
MFHLLCIILSETCCGKNAEAAENCYIFFQLVSVFLKLDLSQTQDLQVEHTNLYCYNQREGKRVIMLQSRLKTIDACVQFQHSSLHLGISIDLQSQVKIKGVP